ncbi:MAG: 4'-phosphopantetheinyl transferase superfamily protein [Lewinellaceae bacterium]|nr:4'-phosphopantetheinyl transferase superfamily protein [Lewinellaceae bacterium]
MGVFGRRIGDTPGAPGGTAAPHFFTFWTRKEAFIKGMGQGLTLPLRQFDVRHTPEQPVQYEGEAMAQLQQNDWFVRDIDLTKNCCAAVAMQGCTWDVSLFRLPDVHPL